MPIGRDPNFEAGAEDVQQGLMERLRQRGASSLSAQGSVQASQQSSQESQQRIAEDQAKSYIPVDPSTYAPEVRGFIGTHPVTGAPAVHVQVLPKLNQESEKFTLRRQDATANAGVAQSIEKALSAKGLTVADLPPHLQIHYANLLRSDSPIGADERKALVSAFSPTYKDLGIGSTLQATDPISGASKVVAENKMDLSGVTGATDMPGRSVTITQGARPSVAATYTSPQTAGAMAGSEVTGRRGAELQQPLGKDAEFWIQQGSGKVASPAMSEQGAIDQGYERRSDAVKMREQMSTDQNAVDNLTMVLGKLKAMPELDTRWGRGSLAFRGFINDKLPPADTLSPDEAAFKNAVGLITFMNERALTNGSSIFRSPTIFNKLQAIMGKPYSANLKEQLTTLQSLIQMEMGNRQRALSGGAKAQTPPTATTPRTGTPEGDGAVTGSEFNAPKSKAAQWLEQQGRK